MKEFTIEEARQRIISKKTGVAVSKSTVTREIRARRLKAELKGNTLFIKENNLEKFLQYYNNQSRHPGKKAWHET